MAPYSLSHRPNLRGHISLMLNFHWALKLLFVFWLLFFLFFFFLVSPWFIFHLDHFSRLTYCLVNLGKKVNPECIRAFEMELVITEPGLYSGHHSSPLQSHHLPHTFWGRLLSEGGKKEGREGGRNGERKKGREGGREEGQREGRKEKGKEIILSLHMNIPGNLLHTIMLSI